MPSTSLTCPICTQPLSFGDKQLICANRHSFDQAKQGYFNLLLSNKKRSKQPGDNIEMVLSRQKFLNTGIYQPISDQLNTLCQEYCQKVSGSPLRVLDLGCGEGYYTERLLNALNQETFSQQTTELCGLDISKDAVKHAAKRSQEITWLVASGADIPVIPHSQDLIVCLFTRLMPEGIARAISQSGRLITVTTGKQHLIEMREILYPKVKDQTLDPSASLSSHFTLESQQPYQYQHHLNSQEQIRDLLAMTPHQWKAPAAGREKLLSLNELTITIDVNFSHFSLHQTVNTEESP